MKDQEIKYIGFYDRVGEKSDRVFNLAAINKMNYIADSLVEIGYKVQIVSPSWMGSNSDVSFEKQTNINIRKNIHLTKCPSWKTTNKISKVMKITFTLCWLFFYLMINTKKGEKILVYHAPWLSLPVVMAKHFKKFELVLEVEEIYGEVWTISSFLKKCESVLLEKADHFIFVSDVLSKRFHKAYKRSIILYGSYKISDNRKQKNSNNYVNIVYAGSLDKVKGGVYNAINSMKNLPNNYKLYILGHGNENDRNNVLKLINNINAELESKACYYEGTKYGKEYENFLYSCDIALNPQIEGDYMLTAFPSKIISYLSHNLRVVTTNINSVSKSSIANCLYFTNDDDPISIANTIKSIDLNTAYDSKKLIKKLHINFIVQLEDLLKTQ